MSSGFYKGPTIADVWDRLDRETKDRVVKMFVAWLVDCLKKVNTDNLALFTALLDYHRKDLVLVFGYMMKDEFAPFVNEILKIFGVR